MFIMGREGDSGESNYSNNEDHAESSTADENMDNSLNPDVTSSNTPQKMSTAEPNSVDSSEETTDADSSGISIRIDYKLSRRVVSSQTRISSAQTLLSTRIAS